MTVKGAVISITLLLFCAVCTGTSTTREDSMRQKQLDKAGYDAISQLHKSMDDDLSGSVDMSESSDFLREELHVKDKDPLTRRQKTFHHNNDDSITVDDLWERWVASDERKWTTDEIVDWLVRSVELPQYAQNFVKTEVNGSCLARLAAQDANYMQSVLGVTNPVHRQKLQLKAMDVVLFGHKILKTNYAKDVLLVALLLVALGAYWFAIYQRKASQKQAQALTAQLGKLKDMEQEFVVLQNKLEEERCKTDSCKGSVADEEIENRDELESLKLQLLEAERQREQRSPLLLSLLRKSYELEVTRINQDKLDSFQEMSEAREMVEKLRKKQSSLLSQIRSVHGSETEIDERILIVRQKMEKTVRAIEDCERRWLEIEYLLGMKIVTAKSSGLVAPGTTTGYRRMQLYGAGHLDVDNNGVAGYPMSDMADHAPLAEGIMGGAHSHHGWHQMGGTGFAPKPFKLHNSSTASNALFAGASPPSVVSNTTSRFNRPLFDVGSSDLLRSASASDLLASGDASSASDGSISKNELVHSSWANADGQTKRRKAHLLQMAQIGKKASQISVGTASNCETGNTATNTTKSKKKILNIFGGSRDKRD